MPTPTQPGSTAVRATSSDADAPQWSHKFVVRRLRDAQSDHDQYRRLTVEGVSAHLLDVEHRRWRAIGEAIAELAQLIVRQCGSSEFTAARPNGRTLTLRLSEAIDDQLDDPAWRVVDAAARLALLDTPKL